MAKQYTLEDGRKFVYVADDLSYVENVFDSLIDECIVGYEEV